MKIAGLLLLAALVAVAGCDSEGRVRPPQTTVRFLNAAPNFGTLALLRERRPEGVQEFGGGLTMRFDSGQYDFGLESSPPASQPVRHVTLSETLSGDTQYTFVAVAPGDQPQLLIAAVPNFPPGSTNARYSIIDAHPGLGAMDVYLVAAGTPLGSVAAQGNISFGPTPATFQVAPQTLRLYLTPAGDPATVLFESTDFVVEAGTDNVLVVHDTGGQTPVGLAVTLIGNTALRINQQGMGALLRVVHGVDDRLARDFVLDDGTTPLFAAQPFGELSDYVTISADQHTLKLTPVGAPGTEESTVQFLALAGRYYTVAFAGNSTDGILGRVVTEDPRPIVQQASLFVTNVAGLFDNVLVYILTPGSDITQSFPRVVTGVPDASARQSLVPGDYEITVQDVETLAVLAGPELVTLAEKGVYGVLLLNAADSVTIDLEYFYDFSP